MFHAAQISYAHTGAFSRIVEDYVSGAGSLKTFYEHPPTWNGLNASVENRKQHDVDRALLVDVLREQYQGMLPEAAVNQNIEALLSPDTFTVCTAHQPNLFTGPLYFMYKVLHAIKLAAHLQEQMPGRRFVPVYYMGSEDADFAELNHTYVQGKKITWQKQQSGAVGRMQVDDSLLKLIDELKRQLQHLPHGVEVIDILESAYQKGQTIQQATFGLLHKLYGSYGLVVLIPDHPRLKQVMQNVFEDDILNHTAEKIVLDTSARLAAHYDAQAHPRPINLFYLEGDIRERITEEGGTYQVLNTDITFSRDAMLAELKAHPERFSPNVILRGLFQESILPNVAFVGGGGELAYWLQLNDVFKHYQVPFPVLVLRNSFLVVEERYAGIMKRHGISAADVFLPQPQLLTLLLQRAGNKPELNGTMDEVESIYQRLTELSTSIDTTLDQHVAALKSKTLKQLQGLEKKMIRAEKRKHTDLQNQLEKLKQQLFPNGGLQERVENFSGFYAQWGSSFIDAVYDASPAIDPLFTVLYQKH